MPLVHLFLVFLVFHALYHARVYSLHYDVVQGPPWLLEAHPVLPEKGEVTDVVEMMELMDPVKVVEVTEVLTGNAGDDYQH